MQGDSFTSKPGGIGEVAMRLCSSLGLVPNYVVLVLGNLVLVLGNGGGGPHYMQGRHTLGLCTWAHGLVSGS